MSHSDFFGKSSQNSPKPVMIVLAVLPCVCVCVLCSLLKVISHCDVCVLAMSGMDFQWMGWWVGGWRELYPLLVDFLELFNFAKPLSNNYEWR